MSQTLTRPLISPRYNVRTCAFYRKVVGLVSVGVAVLLMSPAAALGSGKIVPFNSAEAAGTVVVRNGERTLYLVLRGGRALSFSVGLGRDGKQWVGTTSVDGVHIQPNWAPPAEIRRDKPNLPAVIAGGSPANPMGAAALTLSGGSYAIHGTNMPNSIGGFVSYGCIRMHNQDIIELISYVSEGTKVVVTR